MIVRRYLTARTHPKFTSATLQRNWGIFVVLLGVVIYTIVFSRLSILRHDAFASNYDLANMMQTVWNTVHGRPFAFSGHTGTVTRLSVHTDVILILLAPIYFFWQKTQLILIIQSLALALGAIPTYFLAKTILCDIGRVSARSSNLIALLISIAYLVNPSLEWTNIYDFHPVAFAVPLLLATFYFAYKKQWHWFWVFASLAMVTKEEITLDIAMIGLFLIFYQKEKRMGVITSIVGFVWFAVSVFIIIPIFSNSAHHWAFGWYTFATKTDHGVSISQTLLMYIRKFTTGDGVIAYYDMLLKPFGYLPLLGLPWLLLSFPELAINLLSSRPQMRSILFQYNSPLIPSLVIATIFGIAYVVWFFGKINRLNRYRMWVAFFLAIGLLIAAIRVNYHYSPLPTTPACWCYIYQVDDDDRQFMQVLRQIPASASVTSSSEIRAHLTKRENSFTLPDATNSADYIAIIDQNRAVGDYNPKEYEVQLLKQLADDPSHVLLSHIGHFYLYKKVQ